MDGQLGARQEGRGDDEGGRRGEVAGHCHLVERQLRRRLGRDGARTPSHGRAGGGQHQLGVVARRHRLADRRRALGVEGGEQDRGLDLRARDRQDVLDPFERIVAFDDERIRAHLRAHPFERLGDAIHRAGAQRLVAGELETAALSGEDAGEQPHQRARVAATDWSVGRRQPTQPDAVHREQVALTQLGQRDLALRAVCLPLLIAELRKPAFGQRLIYGSQAALDLLAANANAAIIDSV